MFFPEKITRIRSTDKVLEVGPGSLPSPRSDVWLDYLFEEIDELIQSGNEAPAVGKPKVYYNGGSFPFKDKAFDYVIAAHVLEHVPWDEVPFFIAELERVAKAGYVEVPRWTWELIGDFDVHLLAGNVIDCKLLLTKKTAASKYSEILKKLMTITSFKKLIAGEKAFFFTGMEWDEFINYERNEEDYILGLPVSEVVRQLEKDIATYCSQSNKPGRAQKIKKYCYKIFVCVKRILFQRKRIMTISELRKLLQCPITGSEINVNWKNSSGSFGYEVKRMCLYPIRYNCKDSKNDLG